MIDCVTSFVSDLERSKKFYEQAFLPLGYKISFGEAPHFWAFDIGKGLFEITQYEGKAPITSSHIAFRVENHDKVKAFHKAALIENKRARTRPGESTN